MRKSQPQYISFAGCLYVPQKKNKKKTCGMRGPAAAAADAAAADADVADVAADAVCLY